MHHQQHTVKLTTQLVLVHRLAANIKLQFKYQTIEDAWICEYQLWILNSKCSSKSLLNQCTSNRQYGKVITMNTCLLGLSNVIVEAVQQGETAAQQHMSLHVTMKSTFPKSSVNIHTPILNRCSRSWTPDHYYGMFLQSSPASVNSKALQFRVLVTSTHIQYEPKQDTLPGTLAFTMKLTTYKDSIIAPQKGFIQKLLQGAKHVLKKLRRARELLTLEKFRFILTVNVNAKL